MSGFRADSERSPFASIEVRHGTSLHGISSVAKQAQIATAVTREAAAIGIGANR